MKLAAEGARGRETIPGHWPPYTLVVRCHLMEPYAGRERLRPIARAWRLMCGFLALVDGYSWLTAPPFNGPYKWALQVAPQKGWGLGFLAVSVMCAYGSMADHWHLPLGDAVTRIALAVYGVGCGTVGLSILVTSRAGAPALTGASKWWLVCIITGVLFSQPSLVDPYHPGGGR